MTGYLPVPDTLCQHSVRLALKIRLMVQAEKKQKWLSFNCSKLSNPERKHVLFCESSLFLGISQPSVKLDDRARTDSPACAPSMARLEGEFAPAKQRLRVRASRVSLVL